MTTFRNVLVAAVYVCALTRCFEPTGGARILAVAPIDGKSHWNVISGVLRALTDRGHLVTVITPFPSGDRENYTEVDVSEEFVAFASRVDASAATPSLAGLTDFIIRFNHATSRDACKMMYGSDAVQRVIDGPQSSEFDAVIVEFVASECVSHLSGRLNGVPLVYVSPPPLMPYAERLTAGHYPNPAVVSHVLAGHCVPRTFVERFTNALLLVYSSCLLRYLSWSDGIVDRQPFDLVDPVKPSLVFSNTHYITDPSRTLPPNVIPIGGIHLSPPKKIPEDILEFIENSPHGVILFTFGSIKAISMLEKHVQEVIMETLGQIPQRVLLKYENENHNVSKNVMIKKWFPQRDILLHPNVKLFIGHGGLCGVYEAIDAGVPVIGFPFIYDQFRNIDNLVNAGMAVSMDLSSLTKNKFLLAIQELVDNKEYTENAKIASERFKDRPMTPAQTVDYWTSYVIRHKGAPHLKSHALNLAWYQYYSLDVISVLSLVVGLAVYITIFITRSIYKPYTINIKFKSE